MWDGYSLRRLRGKGAFGEVWEAENASGAAVALKFLRCDDSFSSPKELRNIQAISKLDHPHLLRTERVWSSRGYLVVSMELADGSLAEVLDICRVEHGVGLPQQVACDYLVHAAAALDFLNAHRHTLGGRVVGIQHCDVKPANLLLVGHTVKLGDFGLATQLAAPLVTHRRLGTPAYAAPEVFEGLLSDWSDQYSLAVTYCELRTGRWPFPDAPTRFTQSWVRPAPDLSGLTSDEKRVVQRALLPTPHLRWRSCGEFVAQLARVAGPVRVKAS